MSNNTDKIPCKLTFFGRQNGEWVKIEINLFCSKATLEKLINEANNHSCVKSKLSPKSRSLYVLISHCSIFNAEDEDDDEENFLDDSKNILIKINNLPIIDLILSMLDGLGNLELLNDPMFDYDDYPQFEFDVELSHLSTKAKIREYSRRINVISCSLSKRMTRMLNFAQKSTSPISTVGQDIE